MTANGYLQVVFYVAVVIALAKPLGAYMADIYEGKAALLNRWGAPVERLICRICGVDPAAEMHWTRYALAVLWFSLLGTLAVYALQRLQSALPLLREYIRTKDAGAVLAANWLGAIQVARGAYPEAEQLLLPDSDRLFDPAAQLSPTEVRLAVGNIIALYEAWRKPEQAASWKRRLDELANSKANGPR